MYNHYVLKIFVIISSIYFAPIPFFLKTCFQTLELMYRGLYLYTQLSVNKNDTKHIIVLGIVIYRFMALSWMAVVCIHTKSITNVPLWIPLGVTPGLGVHKASKDTVLGALPWVVYTDFFPLIVLQRGKAQCSKIISRGAGVFQRIFLNIKL